MLNSCFVGRQLDESNISQSANGSFSTVVNVVPFPSFGDFGRGPVWWSSYTRPGIGLGQQQSLQVGGRGVFGAGNRRGQGFPILSDFLVRVHSVRHSWRVLT